MSVLMRLIPRFPVIAKELREQSARPRSFLYRWIFVVLLNLILFQYFASFYSVSNSEFTLGSGGQFIELLGSMLIIPIYIAMPALTCGVITMEKERETLPLLLLTKLGGWRILFEKLLSRVFQMSCLLLSILPLAAVAYSMGGVTTEMLFGIPYLLFLTIIQVGSASVLASCLCSSTATAFLISFALIGLWSISPLFLPIGTLLAPLSNFLGNTVGINSRIISAASLFPPLLMRLLPNLRIQDQLFISIFIWLSAGINLLIAKLVLERFSQRRSTSLIRKLFLWLDKTFVKLNKNVGDIYILPRSADFPESRPIEWRESKVRTFSSLHYQIRTGLALEGLVVMVTSFEYLLNASTDAYLVLLGFVLAASALLLIVHTTSLIPNERNRETMPVLLATPIRGEEIIKQKLRGVWRFSSILVFPLLTIALFVFSSHLNLYDLFTWISAILSILAFHQLLVWVSFKVALHTKTQTRAILTTIAVLYGGLAVWFFLLILFTVYVDFIPVQWPTLGVMLFIAAIIRVHCLDNADQLLGRL